MCYFILCLKYTFKGINIKKIIAYVLSLLVLFGNLGFSNVTFAEESKENLTEINTSSTSSFDDEEKGKTVSEQLLDVQEALELKNQITTAKLKGDGEDFYDIGFLMSHGLLNAPIGSWHEGSFESPAVSLVAHYKKHGKEVKAKDAASYLNKAREFRRTAKKGVNPSKVNGKVDDVLRYRKNGKYIDLADDDRIVSFGTTKK